MVRGRKIQEVAFADSNEVKDSSGLDSSGLDSSEEKRLGERHVGGGDDERGLIRRPPRAMVRGRKIEEVAFTDSSEGEDSSIALTDSSGPDSSEEKSPEGEDDSQGSKKGSGRSGRAQRKPPTKRAPRTRRVSFSGEGPQGVKEDAGADNDGSIAAKATRGELRRRPSRRRQSRVSSSHRLARENSTDLSSLFNSDSRISLATSFQYDSTFNDSVDMMDFGVDHTLRSSNQSSNSSKSLAMNGSDTDSMSKFVDSDGFLDWGGGPGGSRTDAHTGEDEKVVGEAVEDDLQGSKKGGGIFGRAQRKPSTKRALWMRRVSFSGGGLQRIEKDAGADNDGSTAAKATQGELRWRPSRRRQSRISSSHQLARENSIHLPSLFNSDSRISLPSFHADSTFNDSVDMKDFGIDHTRRSANQGSSNSSKSLAMNDSDSDSSGGGPQGVEEDTDADNDGSTAAKATRGELRRRPSRRGQSRISSSHRLARENSIHLSSLFNSDTRISLSSIYTESKNDSVDMMDFGVDHTLRSSNQSSNSSNSMSKFVDSDGFLGWDGGPRGSRTDAQTGEDEKNVKEVAGRRDSMRGSKAWPSLSHLVDKEGFLGWGNGSSCSSDSTASDGAVAEDRSEEKEASAKGEDTGREDCLKRSITSTSLSSLVNSMGFLGWNDEKKQEEDESDFSLDSPASDDAVAEDPIEEREASSKGEDAGRKDCLKRSKTSPSLPSLVDSVGFLGWTNEKKLEEDESDDSPADRCESWHIEDYEDPDGCAPPSRPRCRGLLRSLSWDMLENLLTIKDPKLEAGEPKEGIGTNDIKRILLKSHPALEAECSGGSAAKGGRADAPHRKYLFGGPAGAPLRKSLFGGTRRSGSLDGASSAALVDPDVPLRKSLFGGAMRRRSSDEALTKASPDPCEGYYSRPAIRINREDGVDIGELRRELLLAGVDKAGA